MALDFPSSPLIGQVYTNPSNGYTYQHDGTKWVISPTLATTSTGQFIVSNSAPSVATATTGDIWVNTATTPVIAYVFSGVAWNRLNSGVNSYGATGTEPTNAIAGDLHYDTTLSVLTVYNGATWTPYATQQYVTAAVTTHTAATDPHPQYTTLAEAAAAAPVQSVVQGVGTQVTNDALGNVTVALDRTYTDTLYDPIGTATATVASSTVSTFVGSLPVAASDAAASLLGVGVGSLYAVSPATLSSHVRVRLT